MNDFIAWEMFKDYTFFTMMVFLLVEYFKEVKYIKLIPTKYFSSFIAMTLLFTVSLYSGDFTFWSIPLYFFNGVLISLASNGLANFNKKG